MKALGTLGYRLGKFEVEAQPHVMLRLKRTFGKIKKSAAGRITIEDTIDTARDLEWFLGRYPLEFATPDCERHLRQRAALHRERETLVEKLLSQKSTSRNFEMALSPRDYQKVATELVLATGSLLLCDDMGLGKTCVAIAMLTDGRTRPGLVVVPKSVQRQWVRQIAKFAPQLRTHILKSGKPYDIGALPRARGKANQLQLPGQGTTPDVIISTYHKLAGWVETLGAIVRSVTYDEIQELRRGDESAKGAAARSISRRVEYRLGLTGTPIYNFGGEMFNVLECLRPGALGAIGEFSQEWGGGWAKRVKDPKAFGSFLRSEGLMLRRTRAEVGRELPPLSRVFHTIDSDEKPLDDIKSAAMQLAKVILSTSTESEKGERFRASEELSMLVRMATGIAKAPHVADFVRILVESGEPVVLYGWHRSVYDIWLERLKDLGPVMVTGSETDKQKDDAIQTFCQGKSKVIIISLRSAAGLDGLQHASCTTVHGELDWSPGVHEQADTRVFRDGQTRPVVCFYLVAEDGSDPVVSTLLREKGEQLTGIRDPDEDFFGRLQANDGERVKRLAEVFLRGASALEAAE